MNARYLMLLLNWFVGSRRIKPQSSSQPQRGCCSLFSLGFLQAWQRLCIRDTKLVLLLARVPPSFRCHPSFLPNMPPHRDAAAATTRLRPSRLAAAELVKILELKLIHSTTFFLQTDAIRALSGEKMHTMQLMVEQERGNVEQLRQDWASSNSTKIQHELDTASKRLAKLEKQLEDFKQGKVRCSAFYSISVAAAADQNTII